MRERTYTLLALFVVLSSFASILFTLNRVRFYPQADEGYYLKDALYIADKGIGGYPDLFKEYIENPNRWFAPSQRKVGYVLLSAVWLKIFGVSFISLAYLSLFFFFFFFFFCFLLISYHFAKKHLGAETALLFAILLATSPLNCGMARRALSDSLGNLFIAISLWLFFDLIKRGGVLRHLIFVLVYSYALLTREAHLFFSPILLFYLAFSKFVLKEEVKSGSILSLTIFPAIIVLGAFTLISGGYIYDATIIFATTLPRNPFAIAFGSGPWFQPLINWLLLSPLTFILATGFTFYLFVEKRDSDLAYYFLFVLSFFFIVALLPVSNTARHLIVLETPIRLFSVLMLKELFRERLKLILFVIIGISILDYINFRDMFVEKGIYTPITLLLLRAENIIP